MKSPGWLEVLEKEGSELLQPFEDKDKELLEWPALAVVGSLLPDHRARVERWLESIYATYGKVMVEVPWRSEEEEARAQRWAVMAPDSENEEEQTKDEPWKEPVWAHRLALVALHADPPMPGVVLKAVKDHPTFRDIVLVGVSVVRKIPPSDSSVMDFANMLLAESCWNAWPHFDPVVERLVEGINQSNAVDRVRMLCYKIRPSPNTRTPTFFEANRDGTVVEIANDPPYRRRLFLLVKGLTDAINGAREWSTTRDLLDVLRAVSLPPGLAGRLRAWTLATSSDPDQELLISEVEEAIVSGSPTGDHRLLLDRVVDECDPSSYNTCWRRALGVAPDVEQVERVLAVGELPPEGWVRAWRWVLLLPDGVNVDWYAACQALESKYGQPDRTEYEYRPRRATKVTSPIGVRELQILGPVGAAREIAQWRPDTADWRLNYAGARELGRTLETLVKENPDHWTADPVIVVKTLHHPTYINHYLRRVADVASAEMPINELLDVIKLVRTHPWEAEMLGTGDFAYDPDWSGAEEAAVELIKSLAQIQVHFADRSEEVWDFLETQAANCPEGEPRSPGSILDAYETAINRPCTRALDTVFHLIEGEYRRSETVPSRAVPILDASLRLPGDNGLQHRAILASTIGFLRHVMPQWTETNLDLFFGDQAPDHLGQPTFNMVIKWGQPQPWLLKRYRPMLKRAVRTRVPRALSFLLLAMLHKTDDYSPQKNLNFLREAHRPYLPDGDPSVVGDGQGPAHANHSNMVSEAGASLALLLQREDADRGHLEIAQEFWEAALDSNMSIEGFGWFAEVTDMNPKRWAELTLKTLEATNGRIHASTRVAERITPMTPSKTTLTILYQLIQGRVDRDLRREIAEQAREHLRSATDLETTCQYRRLHIALQERGVGGD